MPIRAVLISPGEGYRGAGLNPYYLIDERTSELYFCSKSPLYTQNRQNSLEMLRGADASPMVWHSGQSIVLGGRSG